MQDLESIFRTAHRQLRPRTPIPEIKVEFFPFAGLNHTARLLHHQHLIIRLSDIFTDAPAEVYHSLALILLAKLYRKKIDNSYHHVYRMFILSSEIQERARIARRNRCRVRRLTSSSGRYVDLTALFDSLNKQYFEGAMDRPQLSWSARRSRYVLGRYDATHHTIFISRVFDAPNIPEYVVEYVMFHEMLHVKHQSRVRDSRIIVHPPEFKTDERRFSHYRQAKSWLKGI